MPKHPIDKCSCDESGHLRAALKLIRHIATHRTSGGWVDDLAQIGNLADQALNLEMLTGDPEVYPSEDYI